MNNDREFVTNYVVRVYLNSAAKALPLPTFTLVAENTSSKCVYELWCSVVDKSQTGDVLRYLNSAVKVLPLTTFTLVPEKISSEKFIGATQYGVLRLVAS